LKAKRAEDKLITAFLKIAVVSFFVELEKESKPDTKIVVIV
jgi:hypothetical protein